MEDTLEFLELLPTLISFCLDGYPWHSRLSLREILDWGRGEDCFYCLGVAHYRLLKNLLEQFPQIVSTPEASSSHVNILKVPLHTSYDLGQSSDLDPEDLDGKVGRY